MILLVEYRRESQHKGKHVQLIESDEWDLLSKSVELLMGKEVAGWVQLCLYYLRCKDRCPAVSDMKRPGLPSSGVHTDGGHAFEYMSAQSATAVAGKLLD